MKYCNTCGNLISNRARKCLNCGELVNKKYEYTESYEKGKIPPAEEYNKKKAYTHKDQIAAKPLSTPKKKNLFFIFPFFLIPGIGFMYAGKWKKGLYFLMSFIVVVIIDVITKVNSIWAIIPITSIAYLVLIIWGIVGAVKQIRAHNEEIETYTQKKSKPMKNVDKAIF